SSRLRGDPAGRGHAGPRGTRHGDAGAARCLVKDAIDPTPTEAAAGDVANDDPLRERLIGSEVIRTGRILEFRIDEIETPDGNRSQRETAAHPGGGAI